MLNHLPPPEYLLAMGIVIFFAIGLHEYAHCKFADMAGDPTPRYYGRVTLNLFKHFDPFGTMMIIVTSLVGVGLGWGKPAPINPAKMRNPRWDTFVAVAAGPLSNVAQATIYAIVLRMTLNQGSVGMDDVILVLGRNTGSFFPALLVLGVMINLSLALFNLIPFGILDGHWLVGQLLPEKQQFYWYKFNRTYGWMILVGIILIGQLGGPDLLGHIIFPPLIFLFRVLTGIHLGP